MRANWVSRARQDDRKVERFGHIVVRAQAHGSNNVFALIFSGGHNDGQVGDGIALTEDLEDVQAADAGHHDIEQHQVKLLSFDHSQGLVAICSDSDRVTPPRQTPREHVPVHLVVVHDEQESPEPVLHALRPPYSKST